MSTTILLSSLQQQQQKTHSELLSGAEDFPYLTLKPYKDSVNLEHFVHFWNQFYCCGSLAMNGNSEQISGVVPPLQP